MDSDGILTSDLSQVMYHSAPNFLEVDIDIGSSTVANNVVRFVLG